MSCNPFHLITFFAALFTLQSFVIAKINGNMTVGAELSTTTGNSSWISSSGDFTFGFHQLDSNTFLPAVWYSNIPDTIIWWAALDVNNASTTPKGSKIVLTDDQGLVLQDPHGNIPWRTPLSGGSAHDCYLEDTGNLVIRSTDGKKLWQSFENPTDTMLPSQTMAAGGQSFYSKLSQTNFNRGRFLLNFTSDGDFILHARSPDPNGAVYPDDTVYYNKATNTSNPGIMLSYNRSGHMYILEKDGTETDLLDGVAVPTPEDYYFRATLNFDGVFVWYSHRKNGSSPNSGWSVITYQPDNICINLRGSTDSGACGYNAICTLGGSDYPRPDCSCPTGYTFLDQDDKFSTCKPNFELGCGENNGYRMEQLENTDWPNNDYDYRDSLTAEECKSSCLGDCLCTASIHRDKGCWKKRYPLSNGYRNSSLLQATAFLKVKNDDNPSVGAEHKGVMVLASSLAASVFVILVLFSVLL